MRVLLPANNLYGNAPVPLDFPDDWDVHVCTYRGADTNALSAKEIAEAIARPGGGVLPVAEGAKGCKDAVIIFDDITRPTPCGEIAKALVAQLVQAGMKRGNIRFVCAVGGHRAMGREEFVRKLGEEIVSEFEVYNHNPFFNNVKVGDSAYGYPIELNASCVAADYKIGIGALFAHQPTGIGGGPKLILPGIASMDTIVQFHTSGTTGQWDLDCDGRKKAAEAARMFGLDFKVDVLLNGRGEIAQLYAGDADANTRANESAIHDFYSCRHAGMGDLVIVNNYFKPSEASNATLPGTRVFDMVRTGGDVVLSSHTPQGAAGHYVFGWWGGGAGGLLYNPKLCPEHINRYFAFSTWVDKGTGTSWHAQGPKMSWHSRWDSIMQQLGTRPRKAVVIPYALVNWFDPPFERVEEAVFAR